MTKTKIKDYTMALLWMATIFYLSSQSAQDSGELSSGVMRWVAALFEKLSFGSSIGFDQLHVFIRKTAHFSAYALLGILTSNALEHDIKKTRVRVAAVLLVCLAYAVSDEVHQSFVPGRGPSAYDVIIDFVGSSTGIMIRTYWSRFVKLKGAYSNEKA
ncbi:MULTISPECIES: VanZ family protein [unclassified Fusibacter]|uniref:VanZ family protein n=1 Tax=unclassified Fusibacter TaxID=2624464 RepID=UPI001012482C|nr:MULTISPECIES: VanZ family protein [unclassified Fusibacter]MCK8060445.1 VanZ family protein [Fusibacter sp. A2]NPE20266.1 VanZ family protein [Fusibacter sp. A1]RXV63473.1 VanZ family protein [Fusibacter sp. A1]